MLRTRRKTQFTPAEYLSMEEAADYKSEYYNGQIYAMVGGTADHSGIKVNLVSALHRQLTGSACRVYDSDLRLHIEANSLYTYPDAMVICGKLRFVPDRKDTVLNPILIAEVLSESTRSYDRRTKFNFYKQVPSLQEYLLIDSERPQVERYQLNQGKWVHELIEGLAATVSLSSIGVELALAEIYLNVSWV